MSLDFPWQMFIQAQQAKNQNRQQMNQDIGSLGQAFGQGLQGISEQVKQAKQKKLMDQLVMAMKNQGAPQQGPQMPGASPMPTQDNSQTINALMTQLDPQAAITAHFRQQKQTSPWRVVSGMLSKNGKPVQQNEQTGEVREASLDAIPTGRGNAGFGVGSITWDTASKQDQDLAKSLYEGNIRTYDLGYRDRTVGVKLANEYAIRNGLPPFQSYSGDIHAGTSKAFAFGKPGMNVLSLNTALGHTQSALDAYDAVSNLDVRFLNSPLNKVREQTDDPNIIKLQTSLNALQGELATVFKGTSGTDQEIGHWSHVLSQDLTPKQALGAIQQIGDLLNSRLDALNQMRETGMGRPGGAPLLSPHAKTISKSISERGSKPKNFNSVQQAEAAGLPVGTKVTINGRPATIQ